MKIGILTHYNVYNLGAQLQMLALEAYLRDLGHTVRILTYEKNFDFRRAEKDRNSGSWRSVPAPLPCMTLRHTIKAAATRS